MWSFFYHKKMFTDHITVKLSAGKGGNGVIAWRREKFIPKGGPCGGNGGRGGAIILKSDPEMFSLDIYKNRKLLAAENGAQGGSNNRQGRGGKDLILKIPCGTLVRDAKTKSLIYDFTDQKEEVALCQGGKGGKGNTFFKTATRQAPAKCTLGEVGQTCTVELELKLIADVGFVGLPNAGKSTLLSKTAKTEVKIGAYPFTTLKPNLSLIDFEDFSRIYLADIPGIIHDAHKNRGLGLSFLRHVERCSILIYVIDISGSSNQDPFKDFLTLRREIEAYSKEILKKPFLVVLNKSDLDSKGKNKKAFEKKFSFNPSNLFTLSALKENGLVPFLEKMRTLAQANGKKYL